MLALAACLICVYCAGPLRFLGNDTRPAVYTAVSLARRGDFDLDEFATRIRGRAGWPYFVTPTVRGTVVSRFGPAVPVLALPAFTVALAARGGRIDEHLAGHLGRFVAASFVAWAAAFVYLASRRLRASRRESLVVAAIYGLGTCAFSVASQALWQHGPAQFFLAVGAFALIVGGRRAHAVAGAALALSAICRPPDALLALAAGVWVITRAWRGDRALLACFAAPAAVVVGLLLAYNDWHFGAPWAFSQLSRVHGADASTLPGGSYWHMNPLVGLAGLLFSPSRGLFVYSPVFALLVLRWRTVTREGHPAVLALLGGFAALVLVISRYYGWYGGWTWGYRMIGDAAPVLCLALVPVVRDASAATRRWLWPLVTASVLVHALGAWNYNPADWDMRPDLDTHTSRLWSLRDWQIGFALTHRATYATW